MAGLISVFTKTKMKLFFNPFVATPSQEPKEMQMEVIELQCDSNLGEKSCSLGVDIFKSLTHLFLKLRGLAASYYACSVSSTFVNKYSS